jgi:hypothetical protein
MDYKQNPSQEASLSSKGKGKRRKVQYCDLEGQDDVVCDYEINNASIISDKVTIPDINRHLNLVGKALCRRHYNKLIVNAKKIKITNTCSHPKHNIYLSTGTEKYFVKPPERLINHFKLSQTAVMCRHCLYKTDNDPEYIDSPIYPQPIQKKILKENIKDFQGRSYILRDDIFYSETEFQRLESAYHEVCAELDEAKLGE